MSAYRKDFDETKYTSFLIKNDELLKKYNKVWKKVKSSLKKQYDNEPVYNEKYLKAKVKSYNEKINTNFHEKKITNKGSHVICLSVGLIDSIFRVGKNYYPQVFLEDCKYVVKKKKIPKYIIDDLEISSDSDEKNSNEENSDQKIVENFQIKKYSDEEDSSKEGSSEEDSSQGNSDEKNCFFDDFLLIVSFVQVGLRKELPIASFVKPLKNANSGKSY